MILILPHYSSTCISDARIVLWKCMHKMHASFEHYIQYPVVAFFNNLHNCQLFEKFDHLISVIYYERGLHREDYRKFMECFNITAEEYRMKINIKKTQVMKVARRV